MRRAAPITFGDFRLDVAAERLWRGETERSLRPKSFAVLRYLAQNRGRLVTKEELFRLCWPKTAVSDTVLRVCIREIRAALDDDALQPTFVTTVGRRGYRFAVDPDAPAAPAGGLVGRDRDLARLQAHLVRVETSRRQIAFVTGEPGIGKTALVERFVEEIRDDGSARVAIGQCAELAGGQEAYLPLLDAFGRLCSEAGGRDVLAILERWAPTWLLQMPGLLDRERADALHRRVPIPNRDRMLRELGEALEALSQDRSFVLVLEDLHWSDGSTVDALAYVAQRTTFARLLIVGTYRPVELVVASHPLKAMKQSLIARGRGVELPLELLTREEVGAYLAERLTGNPIDAALVAEVHRRTEGNPLFLTATIDYLLEHGIITASDGRWRIAARLDGAVPESLRQLVERQLDELEEPARRVLEAASVVGIGFTGASVAAATDLDAGTVEAECSRLAERGQLLCAAGVAQWPDGTMSGSYEFLHGVYREVLYRRIAPARRRRLHAAVAARIEAGHAGQLAEVAAVLASHFAEGGDDQQAARYHAEAAGAAKARFADREVIVHLEAALARLPVLPDTRTRAEDELEWLLDLAAARLATDGYASTGAQAAYERARDLAVRLELPVAATLATSGLLNFHVMRADLRLARAIAEDLLATAERTAVPLLRVIGHGTFGAVLFNLADFPRACVQFEQARAAWAPDFPRLPVDHAVLHLSLGGLTLLHLGRPAEAAAWVGRGLDHAAGLADPFNLSYAHELAAQFHATAGDRDATRRHADASIALATEHGFPGHVAVATVTLGWALRDASVIRAGLAAYEEVGQRIATSFFRALLADVELAAGRVDEAGAALAAALAFAEETGEHRHLAELHRLRGECVLRAAATRGERRRRAADPAHAEAEAWFQRAITIAREQGARLWELRAGTALARLWGASGRETKACALLDEISVGFTAGADCPDLIRARDLRTALTI